MKTSLGNASVGELCKETKFAQSSLYYWFENKDDIWISAGKYGLSKEVEKYKYELRLAVQITTSPVFGDHMRGKAMDFRMWYSDYAEKLIGIFSCTHEQAKTFIFSIIYFVIDYVIWDDIEKTQMLDNLYERVMRTLDIK